MKRFLILALLFAATPAWADSSYAIVSAGSTNSTQVITGRHELTGFSVVNNSTAAYLKLYDTATAPTCGSGTPYAVFGIPGNLALAGSNFTPATTILFTKGIGYCITGAAANADTTAVGVGQVAGTLVWK
jgi:hypothetical protein